MAFNYSPKVVTDGLVLYWDAGNPRSYISGSTSWNDISRSGLNGTLVNGPTFDSTNGGSIMFDGSNDYASTDISPITSSIQTNNRLTLSAFFKPNFSGQYRDLVGVNKTTGNNPFTIRLDISNNIFFDISVGGTRWTPRFATSYTPNTWYHVCGTFGDNITKTYLNGQFINQTTTSGSLATFTTGDFGVIYLGYASYSGNVASVQLYNRDLSAQEVRQNYNAHKSRFGL